MQIKLFLFTIASAALFLGSTYIPYKCQYPMHEPINVGTHNESGGMCFDNRGPVMYDNFPIGWFGGLGLIFAAYEYRWNLKHEQRRQ